MLVIGIFPGGDAAETELIAGAAVFNVDRKSTCRIEHFSVTCAVSYWIHLMQMRRFIMSDECLDVQSPYPSCEC